MAAIWANKNSSRCGWRALLSKKQILFPPFNWPSTDRDILYWASPQCFQLKPHSDLNLTWLAVMPGKNYATTHIIILITTVYFRSPGGGEKSQNKASQKWKCLSDQRNLFTKKRENVETSRREDSSKHHILQRERKKKTNCSIKFEHLLGDGLTAMRYVGAFQERQTSHTKYRPENVYLGILWM